MADPLTINVRQAAAAAPAVYTVPGAVEVEPLSAFASFDGSGAAASFLPSLAFYSASGLLISRAFPTDAIAAGASADVSYFPGVGVAAASSATTAFDTITCTRITNRTVFTGGTTDLGAWDSATAVGTSFDTSNALTTGEIIISRTGIYLFSACIEWTTIAQPTLLQMFCLGQTLSPFAGSFALMTFADLQVPGGLGQAGVDQDVTGQITWVELDPTAANNFVKLRLGNDTGGNMVMDSAAMWGTRLGDV